VPAEDEAPTTKISTAGVLEAAPLPIPQVTRKSPPQHHQQSAEVQHH